MLLEGEIRGVAAPDLVRAFTLESGDDDEWYPPEQTTIQLKRLADGVSVMEMFTPERSVSIALKSTWNSKAL